MARRNDVGVHAEGERLEIIAAELARVDGARPGPAATTAKHAKMARSAFTFMRGSAQLYYADLAAGRLRLPPALLAPPLTRVQGDCHLANFGLHSEDSSNGGRVVWDVNDFDDAAVAHAAFDLLRFCVSLFLAGEHCRGLAKSRHCGGLALGTKTSGAPSDADMARAAAYFVRQYRRACDAMLASPRKRDRAIDGFGRKHVLAAPLARARRRTANGDRFLSHSTLGKAAELRAGRLRFRERPGRFAPLEAAAGATLRRVFRPYVHDEILDIVQRLGAGTGSLTAQRFYLLVGPQGRLRKSDLRLAHVVEVKQQRQASLVHHFPNLSPINTLNPAHLAIDCQRQMSQCPDLILDELTWNGSTWLVRSRPHARLGFAPEDLLGHARPERVAKQFARTCATALARAHARGDRRSARFEAAMHAALASTGDALVALARRYAARTVLDHQLLQQLLASGH